jgi:hypothetical protein
MYTKIQAYEALDLACAARDVIHAKEIYTLEHFSEGGVQMLALENKVMEVKNRLRIADLQLAFIRRRVAVQGLAPSDNDAKGLAERL